MRKLFLCFFVLAFLCSCAQEVQKEKIPFVFTPERRLMSVPVTIQGVSGKMLLDTGCGNTLLDTTYAAKIAPFDSISQQSSAYDKGFFYSFSEHPVNIYKGLLKMKIGNRRFDDKKFFSVGDYRTFLDIPEFDGMFGFADLDSLHIWELNFEENYISIIPADSFQLDGDFLTLPLKWYEGKTVTTLPINICTKQGVEVKVEEDFIIDTGSHTDVLFMPETEEAKELNTQKYSAYWLWNRHFWDAEMTVCNRVKLDSVRVYVYDAKLSKDTYKMILGLNFLKRFNVYFDLKNNQLYLKPIKTFERITQGKRPWGKFSSSQKNGKDIIDRICDYQENPAIKAGFQVGDEIISINGKLNSEYSEEDWEKLSEEEIWNYVVKRDGKLLNLTLHRNLDRQIED